MKNEFEPHGKIGHGRFSEVYRVLNKKEGKYYAAKIIDRTKINKIIDSQIQNEILFLKNLKHENIIKYITHEITDKSYCIITDIYASGSLSQCLNEYKKQKKKPFSEAEVQRIMKQIVDGVRYLHQNDIIHRDLKLDNIFVQLNYIDYNNKNMLDAKIAIGDFGSACKGNLFNSIQGTPANMSPSLLNNKDHNNNYSNESFDKSADIWALGTICYEMITGKRVFNGKNISELHKNVENGNFELSLDLSYEIISFITKMLHYDRNKRPTIEQLSMHPFLTKDITQFKKADLNKIKSKIGQNGINLNIKANNTIWNVFDENESILKSSENSFFPDFSNVSENVGKASIKQVNQHSKMMPQTNKNYRHLFTVPNPQQKNTLNIYRNNANYQNGINIPGNQNNNINNYNFNMYNQQLSINNGQNNNNYNYNNNYINNKQINNTNNSNYKSYKSSNSTIINPSLSMTDNSNLSNIRNQLSLSHQSNASTKFSHSKNLPSYNQVMPSKSFV